MRPSLNPASILQSTCTCNCLVVYDQAAPSITVSQSAKCGLLAGIALAIGDIGRLGRQIIGEAILRRTFFLQQYIVQLNMYINCSCGTLQSRQLT